MPKPALDGRPILWRYWEILPHASVGRPGYIDLCYASHDLHCGKDFQIISLDKSNIDDYLPHLAKNQILSTLPIQQRVDYYRYHLLREYGGVWIDADILTLKSLAPIYQRLQESPHDYCGFGCGRDPPNPDPRFCKDHPTNWLMMSKKGGRFVTRLCEEVDNILQKRTMDWEEKDYHGIGKDALHATLQNLKEEDPSWDYLHFPSLGQEFDLSGKKLNNIFEPFDTTEPPGGRFYFPLYHSAPGYPEWFQRHSADQLLKGSNGIPPSLTSLFQKAFPSMKSTP